MQVKSVRRSSRDAQALGGCVPRLQNRAS